MQVDSCGFPKGRDEVCPEESACRNGPAAILSVSTGCDPGEGPSSEMGTALGRQGPNNGRTRVAGPPRKKPRGRSPVPQFDAQARPNTNRCPPLSEWLRGENRFEAKRGIAPNQHQEMRKTNRTLL